MSFDGESFIGLRAWPKDVGKARFSRGVFMLEDIAEALDGLVRLSNGTSRHLTLVGVAGVSLTTAIGDWLFDMRVAIYVGTEDDDGLRYRNMEDDSEPQLTVIYTRGQLSNSIF